jgi:hypothetical protein
VKRHVADCHFSSLYCPALIYQAYRRLALDTLPPQHFHTLLLQYASLFLLATPAHALRGTRTERKIAQS